MSTETAKPIEGHLALDAEERAELVAILERALAETRVEAHRTHTPDFRDEVHRQQSVIRRLLEKLKRPLSGAS
jgi:hypothetical protein